MSDDTPDPGGQNTPVLATRGFVLAAATVVVIAVLGIAVSAVALLDGGDGEASGTATAGESAQEGQIGEGEYPDGTPSAGDVPRSDGSESVCGLASNGKTDFTGFPEDTSWDFAGTMKAPAIPGHGPGAVEDNGYRHCYAKTPAGAALAGMNFIAMTSDPTLIGVVIEKMFAEGPGKKAARKTHEEEQEQGIGADQGTDTHIGGVRLLAYGADRARVDVVLVVEGPQSGMASQPIDLRWEEGDWKVVARDDGEMMIPQTVIYSLAGYTATSPEADG